MERHHIASAWNRNARRQLQCFAIVSHHRDGISTLIAGGFFRAQTELPRTISLLWHSDSWHSLGDGTDFYVHALAVFDDGTGPAIYAGGEFDSAGGRPAHRIAKFGPILRLQCKRHRGCRGHRVIGTSLDCDGSGVPDECELTAVYESPLHMPFNAASQSFSNRFTPARFRAGLA